AGGDGRAFELGRDRHAAKLLARGGGDGAGENLVSGLGPGHHEEAGGAGEQNASHVIHSYSPCGRSSGSFDVRLLKLFAAAWTRRAGRGCRHRNGADIGDDRVDIAALEVVLEGRHARRAVLDVFTHDRIIAAAGVLV